MSCGSGTLLILHHNERNGCALRLRVPWSAATLVENGARPTEKLPPSASFGYNRAQGLVWGLTHHWSRLQVQ